MMSSNITTALIVLTSVAALKSYHPMKVAIALLAISAVIMTHMAWKSQSSILPQIYFMMFAGGILVMMMILAALSPNQKTSQSKKVATILLLVIALMPSQEIVSTSLSSTTFVSTMMNQGENFVFLMCTILCYFLVVMTVLDSMKNAMRTFH